MHSLVSKVVTEFIGTFFLLLVALIPTKNPENGNQTVGMVLCALVYAGGHISGAQYNPAVSLGVFIRGKLNAIEFGAYVAAQLAASIFSPIVSRLFTKIDPIPPQPNAEAGPAIAILCEALCTFILVTVVLNVATTKKISQNSFYGIAIGFTVAAIAGIAGPISGGGFNPAMGFGPFLTYVAFYGGNLQNMYIYWVGPLLGGALAGLIYRVMNPEEFGKGPEHPEDYLERQSANDSKLTDS